MGQAIPSAAQLRQMSLVQLRVKAMNLGLKAPFRTQDELIRRILRLNSQGVARSAAINSQGVARSAADILRAQFRSHREGYEQAAERSAAQIAARGPVNRERVKRMGGKKVAWMG